MDASSSDGRRLRREDEAVIGVAAFLGGVGVGIWIAVWVIIYVENAMKWAWLPIGIFARTVTIVLCRIAPMGLSDWCARHDHPCMEFEAFNFPHGFWGCPCGRTDGPLFARMPGLGRWHGGDV